MENWIKVEDKLPEYLDEKPDRKHNYQKHSDHVICTIKATTKAGTRYIVKEGYIEECYCEPFYFWRVPGSQNNVVAWMPMPKYEEKE